jgi:hypothetical protein
MTPRQEEAQARVHKLLAGLVDVVGPLADGQTDFAPGEGPVGSLTLWEFAVVGCWVDDDGKEFVSVLPAAGMLNHHTVGLLHAALAYGAYEAP